MRRNAHTHTHNSPFSIIRCSRFSKSQLQQQQQQTDATTRKKIKINEEVTGKTCKQTIYTAHTQLVQKISAYVASHKLLLSFGVTHSNLLSKRMLWTVANKSSNSNSSRNSSLSCVVLVCLPLIQLSLRFSVMWGVM